MPMADLGDRQLTFVRRGTGVPLLLIQGMAAHHQLWGETLLDGLARDFDVVAYDHRGIGESTDVDGEFTVADLADDAAALMDHLGWTDAHVLGFSLGGMTAQEFVLRHPDRVRRLVLVGTYPGGPETVMAAPGPMAMFEAMRTGDAEIAVRAAYHANLSPSYTADEAHYEPFKQVSLAVRVRVPTVLRQAKAAFIHDASTRLGSVETPTLVLHGTEDQMIDYRNGELLARLIPGAGLHSFTGVGHLIWWERPDETISHVREHLLNAQDTVATGPDASS